jgi:hypothetical protein
MFGQNKKKSNFLSNTANSFRKKASKVGYKAANTGGYVAGRTSAKVAKTPVLRKASAKVAKVVASKPVQKVNSTKPVRQVGKAINKIQLGPRAAGAMSKGFATGVKDSAVSSFRKRRVGS